MTARAVFFQTDSKKIHTYSEYICDVRGRRSTSSRVFFRSAHGHQPKGTAVLSRRTRVSGPCDAIHICESIVHF